jgi:hypothetical protein
MLPYIPVRRISTCASLHCQCLNADDQVVGYVNQDITGIPEPTTHSTVAWPVNRLCHRVNGGVDLHNSRHTAAPAPLFLPLLTLAIGPPIFVVPEYAYLPSPKAMSAVRKPVPFVVYELW